MLLEIIFSSRSTTLLFHYANNNTALGLPRWLSGKEPLSGKEVKWQRVVKW